jgi:hypothetical protein
LPHCLKPAEERGEISGQSPQRESVPLRLRWKASHFCSKILALFAKVAASENDFKGRFGLAAWNSARRSYFGRKLETRTFNLRQVPVSRNKANCCRAR